MAVNFVMVTFGRDKRPGYEVNFCFKMKPLAHLCIAQCHVSEIHRHIISLSDCLPVLAFALLHVVIKYLLEKTHGLQVALILPCMRLGEAVLGAEKLPVTGVGFRDLWDHPAKVFPVVGHALMGFAILLPFFIIGLTLALRPVFVWCKRRYWPTQSVDTSSCIGANGRHVHSSPCSCGPDSKSWHHSGQQMSSQSVIVYLLLFRPCLLPGYHCHLHTIKW